MSVINSMLKSIEQRESGATLPFAQKSIVVAPIYDYQTIALKCGVVLIAITAIVLAYIYLPTADKKIKRVDSIVERSATKVAIDPLIKSEVLDKPNTLVTAGKNKLMNSASYVEEKALVNDSGANQVTRFQKPAINQQPMMESNSESGGAVAAVVLKSSTPEIVNAAISKPMINSSEDTFSIKKASVITTMDQQNSALLAQARNALEFGLQQEATDDLVLILQRDPEHIEARNLLAASYFLQQDILAAQSILEEGIGYDPNVLHWRVLLSKIYITRRQYSMVLQLLGDEFEPQADNQFWTLKGTAAQQLEEHDVALRCFEKLTRLQPQESKWWLALATSKDALGDYQNAKRYYQTALKMGGLSPVIQSHAEQRLLAIKEVS